MIPNDIKNYGSGIITVPTTSKASGHPVVDIGDKTYPVNKETLDVDHNQLNRDLANKQIEYTNAQARGDQAAMQRAASAGAELRKAGATVEISPEVIPQGNQHLSKVPPFTTQGLRSPFACDFYTPLPNHWKIPF